MNTFGLAVCVKMHLLRNQSDVKQKSTVSEIDRYYCLYKTHDVAGYIQATLSTFKLKKDMWG